MQRALTLIPLLALTMVACGGDDDASDDASVGGVDAAVTVDTAWARTSPAGVTTGAVYFDVTAAEADTLIAASVPASVAGEAQIHEVVAAEASGDEMSGEMTGEDHAGMDDGEMAMVMQELVDGLPLPAGTTVSLEPGGYHVMLLDLAGPLEAGDEFDVTLDFATAADVTFAVTVGDTAPGS